MFYGGNKKFRTTRTCSAKNRSRGHANTFPRTLGNIKFDLFGKPNFYCQGHGRQVSVVKDKNIFARYLEETQSSNQAIRYLYYCQKTNCYNNAKSGLLGYQSSTWLSQSGIVSLLIWSWREHGPLWNSRRGVKSDVGRGCLYNALLTLMARVRGDLLTNFRQLSHVIFHGISHPKIL